VGYIKQQTAIHSHILLRVHSIEHAESTKWRPVMLVTLISPELA